MSPDVQSTCVEFGLETTAGFRAAIGYADHDDPVRHDEVTYFVCVAGLGKLKRKEKAQIKESIRVAQRRSGLG